MRNPILENMRDKFSRSSEVLLAQFGACAVPLSVEVVEPQNQPLNTQDMKVEALQVLGLSLDYRQAESSSSLIHGQVLSYESICAQCVLLAPY